MYSHQVESDRPEGADDDHSVHHVPELPEIGAGMQNDTEIDDLEEHLDGKDAGEGVIELVQDVVSGRVLVNGVFGRKGHRTKAYDYHDEKIEVAEVDHPMGSSSYTGRKEFDF